MVSGIKYIKAATVMIIALALILPSCKEKPANPAQTGKLPDYPRRIISMAPSITEILFALGAGDRVAGVTNFCDWPPEAKDKPKVGDFSKHSMEMIISLSPDLVIATSDAPNPKLLDDLKLHNLPYFVVGSFSLDGIVKEIKAIGEVIGEREKAAALAINLETRINQVAEKVKSAKPVRTVLVLERNPLITAGPGTFIDDIIRAAGGVNIASDSLVKYPKYSIERLIYDSPEVLIDSARMNLKNRKEHDIATIDFWQKYDAIPAVQNGRIITINPDIIVRPGPRLVDGFEELARALHPELFEEAP